MRDVLADFGRPFEAWSTRPAYALEWPWSSRVAYENCISGGMSGALCGKLSSIMQMFL